MAHGTVAPTSHPNATLFWTHATAPPVAERLVIGRADEPTTTSGVHCPALQAAPLHE